MNAGTIFKLDATGALTTLHRFTSGDRWKDSYGFLTQAVDGSFYGTTYEGWAERRRHGLPSDDGLISGRVEARPFPATRLA